MNPRRKPEKDARRHASERVVGQEPWKSVRGKTMGEFMGAASVWIAVGLALGFVLWGWLVPWLALYSRSARWEFAPTAAALLLILGALALIWIVAAGHLNALRTRSQRAQVGVPLALSLSAVLILSGWAAHGSESTPVIVAELGGRFAFGPTLTRERMAWVEEEGFIGVISLLHPEGEAKERQLLDRERTWAARRGVEIVAIPLRPDRALNEKALERLWSVAEGGEGPYYVHAGPDRHRLEVVRNLLIRATGWPAVLSNRMAEVDGFERGPVYRLEEDVFFTPFPTDSELLNYYLGGSTETVVSLLDPERPDHQTWTRKEREILTRFGIELHHVPLVADLPFLPEEAMEAAETVRSLPRPVVIHTFLVPSVPAEAFLQAYLGRVPPIPPGLFASPLASGRVRVVAPNVAVGPRPAGREFGQLYVRGIRLIAHVGEAPASRLQEDRALSQVAGLEWYRHGEDEAELLARMRQGGPWYLYGPRSGALAEQIAERYGPAVPTSGEEREGSVACSAPSGTGGAFAARRPGTRTPAEESVLTGVGAREEVRFGAIIRSDHGP